MTKQIADFLMERLQPRGVGVVVEASHLCAVMRGVRKPGTIMTTSHVLGPVPISRSDTGRVSRTWKEGRQPYDRIIKTAPATHGAADWQARRHATAIRTGRRTASAPKMVEPERIPSMLDQPERWVPETAEADEAPVYESPAYEPPAYEASSG